MQTVQTEALPPNQGRICLAMIGCTRNSRNALVKTVAAKRSIRSASKSGELYGYGRFTHGRSLLAQLQNAILPVALSSEPREGGREGRILPAPRQPVGIVQQPQRPQWLDERELLAPEGLELLVTVQHRLQLLGGGFAVARQQHPQVLHRRSHTRIVQVDEMGPVRRPEDVAGMAV